MVMENTGQGIANAGHNGIGGAQKEAPEMEIEVYGAHVLGGAVDKVGTDSTENFKSFNIKSGHHGTQS
jgi:hypothetical protein